MDDAVRARLVEGEALGQRYGITIPETSLTGSSGGHLGKGIGSSVDFQDYREYEAGDDLRRIDWSLYGRTDKLIVKLFREEVNPHVDLLIDASASMALQGTEKGNALLRTSAALAVAAGNSRCTTACWLAGEGFRRIENDRDLPSTWNGIELNSKRNFQEALSIMPPVLKRQSIRILLSDLLWMGDPMQSLRPCADGAAALYVVQLLARTDTAPATHGNMRLLDSESGEMLEVYVDAMLEKQYLDGLRRHQQSWETACRQTGAHFISVVAEELKNHLEPFERAGLLVPA